MDVENTGAEPEETAANADDVETTVHQDWLLEYWVGLAEQGVSISVTLTVGGSIISGNLMSTTAYYTAIAQQLGSTFRTAPGAAPVLKDIQQQFNGWKDEATEVVNEIAANPLYIHISDVAIHAGAQIITYNDGIWRGQLAAVDGFIIGRPGGQ